MNIIDRESLINKICDSCLEKKYTIGFNNTLVCNKQCNTIRVIYSHPKIIISKTEFKRLQTSKHKR